MPEIPLYAACLVSAAIFLAVQKAFRSVLIVVLCSAHWFVFSYTSDQIPGAEKSLLEASSPQTLNVAAANMRYYSFGAQHISQEWKRSDVDVALLSENSLTFSDYEKIRKALPDWNFLMGKQSETGILTRWPVLEFRELELPSHQASLDKPNTVRDQKHNQKRSFVHAVINLRGTPVNLISVRFVAGRPENNRPFRLLEWGRYLISQQSKELDFFESYISSVKGPLIFGGDLNATPNSFVIQKLKKSAHQARMNPWLEVPTFPTLKIPFFTLDYLFSANGALPIETKISDLLVSDHRILQSTFQIPRCSDRTECLGFDSNVVQSD